MLREVTDNISWRGHHDRFMQLKRRHHLTWWRHPDVALSRISWFFPFFVFLGKHNEIQIKDLIHKYVFKGGESNGDNNAELARTVDRKKPYQYPVKGMFEGIIDCLCPK